ncbi:hypothetical protein COL26b_013822 [Colletotrichum chrysophilum]|uniref:uncharacterized protein n=1 Tax=Colletotrichum chrysophilum TaxID=1836956 RepID=UPI00230072E6|nr:uncharacterized protein COL26b_013822 [Colletotrichum chrysophilum]KAJ0361137.1 hypothetical protein COL26b_013822 [Colletotrichum chrysophilum]
MPRPKRSVISNAKWDRFEPLIRQLYLQDDKTLPEVIEELHAYDFDPSVSIGTDRVLNFYQMQ